MRLQRVLVSRTGSGRSCVEDTNEEEDLIRSGPSPPPWRQGGVPATLCLPTCPPACPLELPKQLQNCNLFE